jgi:hypothetical protein
MQELKKAMLMSSLTAYSLYTLSGDRRAISPLLDVGIT